MSGGNDNVILSGHGKHHSPDDEGTETRRRRCAWKLSEKAERKIVEPAREKYRGFNDHHFVTANDLTITCRRREFRKE
jgi:hypothetical protein